MKRLLALALIVTLGNVPAVFAGEPLLVSATRLAREVTATQSTVKSDLTAAKELGVTSFAKAAGVGEPAALAQQPGGPGAVSQSGMSKRTKALIFAAVGVAFVGSMYGIDHRVKDVTPSSLGERHENDVFNK